MKKIKRLCKIKKCDKKHYAKNYCKKHYAYYITNKNKKHRKKCDVEGCNKITVGKYCGLHRDRLKRGLPLDNKRYPAKGKRNGNWKGGISYFRNHYLLKKNRLIKLNQVNWKCEVCGEYAYTTWHKDGSTNNHKVENLKVLCDKCKFKHYKKKSTSKYIEKYGTTLSKFSHKLNIPISVFKYNLDKDPIKLEEIILKITEKRKVLKKILKMIKGKRK